MGENIFKAATGTAGELFENRSYNRMIRTYGESATQAIVAHELASAGETWESIQIYARVKRKIQNDEISFIRAEKAAKALGRDVLKDAGLGDDEYGFDPAT
jgi:hypothetical protein